MPSADSLRWLVTGGRGMLGTDVGRALSERGATDVRLLGSSDLDITDRDAVLAAVTDVDVVVNAAAYTAVDAAESDEDAAFAVNALGAENLALAARAAGARLVQVSTDYVFDGSGVEIGIEPYPEDAPLAPLGAYGRTKAEGERRTRAAHPDGTLIVRTAWLYGAHGTNFPRTMVRLAGVNDTVSVVADQIGQPTWTYDLARWIIDLIEVDAPAGVFHGTNSGQASWFEFAQHVYGSAGLDPARVLPTTSAEFVRPAPRPAWSVLAHDAWRHAGLDTPRPWTEALRDAANEGALTTP